MFLLISQYHPMIIIIIFQNRFTLHFHFVIPTPYWNILMYIKTSFGVSLKWNLFLFSLRSKDRRLTNKNQDNFKWVSKLTDKNNSTVLNSNNMNLGEILIISWVNQYASLISTLLYLVMHALCKSPGKPWCIILTFE